MDKMQCYCDWTDQALSRSHYLLISMAAITGCQPDLSTSLIAGLRRVMTNQRGMSKRNMAHVTIDTYHNSITEQETDS